MALIALVTVVTMVSGARKEFKPGEELPELSDHDKKALLAAGSIEDTDATAKSRKAEVAAEKKALKDFNDSKAAVQAAQESIASATEVDAETGANAEQKDAGSPAGTGDA